MAERTRAHPNVGLPRVLHQIHHVPKDKRVIIIGDVHGCLDELELLLDKAEFDAAKDVLVFVGDLVNKGPKSVKVVQFARESGALCVRGNHDDAALNGYYLRQSGIKDDARYEYTDGFCAADIEFLEQLPFTIDLPEINTIVVHAGMVPGVPVEEQSLGMLYKMRFIKTGEPSTALESGQGDSVLWAATYHGPKLVVFGHDAKAGLQDTPFALGLDTGCCYGKKLTAVVLPERRLVSVDALKVYTAPGARPSKSWGSWLWFAWVEPVYSFLFGRATGP
ncbi:hypothetical protein H310_14418 [Aphanomyces invadans]|uniref:Calcineurin-like phosphoesterase domain-containing protein n=1 Tax=Aphanomyces invadans TaxID=157072 RepID=A0A024TB85_9STRA|nr:hypothetical protein H310_14418 [Aphanomyces invadans]ETV90861.1 hypothetical protein H310_14418 [Aphanomyces invadans]|eukprot:XP_008880497.1 hypothetical protein H310_14418 [Aphanomyces invadans]